MCKIKKKKKEREKEKKGLYLFGTKQTSCRSTRRKIKSHSAKKKKKERERKRELLAAREQRTILSPLAIPLPPISEHVYMYISLVPHGCLLLAQLFLILRGHSCCDFASTWDFAQCRRNATHTSFPSKKKKKTTLELVASANWEQKSPPRWSHSKEKKKTCNSTFFTEAFWHNNSRP